MYACWLLRDGHLWLATYYPTYVRLICGNILLAMACYQPLAYTAFAHLFDFYCNPCEWSRPIITLYGHVLRTCTTLHQRTAVLWNHLVTQWLLSPAAATL